MRSGMIRHMSAIPLQANRIRSSLSDAAAAALTLDIRSSVGSTNDVVRELADTQSCHGMVVMAEEQTAGRGRRGRSWHSPAGANLYCSLGWRFELALDALSGLSLAVGAMLAEAIAAAYDAHLALKWPNDLYHGERKLGGVLIEMLGERDGRQQVVVGVGLNVNMPAVPSEAIQQPWTDLCTVIGGSIDRNLLAAGVLNQMAEGLQQLDKDGMADWLERWRQCDWLKGRSVVVEGSPPVRGLAAGIDETGALLVETDHGRSAVSGGEASLLSIGGMA